MIARNEEDCLEAAFESVRDLATEIILVDTGSDDRTVDLAESLGARVIRSTWRDDFSKARNLGLEAASCDWILCLDADEKLMPGQRQRIKSLLAGDADAYFV